MPRHPRRLSWDEPAPADLIDQLARFTDCAKCGNPVDPEAPQPCDEGDLCEPEDPELMALWADA